MDPNKIDFKSNKEPHFIYDEWEFYWFDMRVYNSKQDSWYRFKIKEDSVRVQLYPHGFFWVDIDMLSTSVAELQSAYADYILLEDE